MSTAVRIGVPLETAAGEIRVAVIPEVATRLKRLGFDVLVERGAGGSSFFDDESYEKAGAQIVSRAEALAAEVVTSVSGVGEGDVALLTPGAILIGLLSPLDTPEALSSVAARGVSAVAMELVPRITRAQRMDALSAMSTIAGYRAVILAAERLPKFFPLLTTAAGTVRPARALVLGAGVAGLQALATARRLGAVTTAYDVRDAAREQVASVGAKFLDLELGTGDAEDARGYAKALAEDQQARQIAALAERLTDFDVVISTALIPGRPAPILIDQTGVENMPSGSVIVDLAAANGGNCVLTRADETVTHGGVTILGPTNLPAGMAMHASQLYARTVLAMIEELTGGKAEAAPTLDFNNPVVKESVVTHAGEIVNPRVREKLGLETA
ncbi:Re/Si-specific NAD(P)(+) transhydrogenase subunit alpha [soil metagenome]